MRKIQEKHDGSSKINKKVLNLLKSINIFDVEKILRDIDHDRILERYGNKTINMNIIDSTVMFTEGLSPETKEKLVEASDFLSMDTFPEEREANLQYAREAGLI